MSNYHFKYSTGTGSWLLLYFNSLHIGHFHNHRKILLDCDSQEQMPWKVQIIETDTEETENLKSIRPDDFTSKLKT